MGSPTSRGVPDPTLYLFDGYNLLHAGDYADARQLVDRLASFVAQQGARGIVVFDGHGQDLDRGPLQVRYAPHADTLLERLAAEHRHSELVCLVSSDLAVRGTSGVEVRKLSSKTFLRDLGSTEHQEPAPLRLSERLDDETRAKLEKLRRGQET
jgi:predicted RNA-binding protein with PIN domain